MSAMPFQPELFLFFAINFFLGLSLLSCLSERLFPAAFPYLCQVMAIVGYAQLWINYTYLSTAIEARFWGSLIYLVFVISMISAVTIYVALVKRRVAVGGLFLGGLTMPTASAGLFVVSHYVNGLSVPMPQLPVVPMEIVQVLFGAGLVILTVSAVYYLRQERMLKMFAKVASPIPTAPQVPLSALLERLDSQFVAGEIESKEYLEKRKALLGSENSEKSWLQTFEKQLEKLGLGHASTLVQSTQTNQEQERR
ncbi:MAG: hypothetical protein N3D85_00720 [Candidatus Bathyarchaeota archaeon]|nr:hypothetical protein [Candidatus Bathyarchaeota archaeon]